MVGNVLAALGVAATMELAGVDLPPLDAVGKLADAIALSKSCPSLQLDKEIVSRTLAKAGINIAPIIGEVTQRSQSMALHYVLLDYKGACALARDRYGKDGKSAAGFLAER